MIGRLICALFHWPWRRPPMSHHDETHHCALCKRVWL